MPTQNQSSNTELSKIVTEALVGMVSGVTGMKPPTDEPLPGFIQAPIDRAVTRISGLLAQPAPQPHPEPIAWMVGTAFWWTKEEAERDAAATGLAMVPVGPINDPGEVERLKQELLVARAQGRAEVVEMIAQLDAETGLDEFIGSHQIGCTGEWGSHWKEDTLRHHFDVDLGAASELERCRHSGYEIIILEEERDTLRAQLSERDALLRDINKRHSSGVDFDLPADLAARVKALSASAEQSAPVERDERAAFEGAYCEYFNALPSVSTPITPEQVKQTRDGNHYGHGSLGKNLRWAGWQMRAALERKPS